MNEPKKAAEEPQPPLTVRSLDQLEALLIEGIESGESIPADANFWRRKREKVSTNFGPEAERR